MLRIRSNLVSGITFLLFSIVFMILIPYQIDESFSGSNYAIGPRSFPYLIAIIIMVFSISLIFQSLVLKKERIIDVNIEGEKRTLIYFAIIIAYVILINIIGYLFASLLLGAGSLVFLKAKSWRNFLYVFIFIAIIYFSFKYFLDVKLP